MVYLGREDIHTLLTDVFNLTQADSDDVESLRIQYGFIRGYLAAINTLTEEKE